jgi:hypothetical protein
VNLARSFPYGETIVATRKIFKNLALVDKMSKSEQSETGKIGERFPPEAQLFPGDRFSSEIVEQKWSECLVLCVANFPAN